ncbi:MAG: 50S ribosomal protein L6 [Planctomycetota bacterium]
MSRIGKQPVTIPAGVTVEEKGRLVTVKGPKGQLQLPLRPEIDLAVDGGKAQLSPNGHGSTRTARAMHGLQRALLQNMVDGVTKGFTKELEIQGVGWNANGQGSKIVLNIGFCHQVTIDMPQGVDVKTPSPTTVVLTGIDKQAVGQTAARIRKVRPPEPYKGKGIRYKGEYVRRKAGKSFGS